jgi:hypothetical protein
LKSFIVIGLDLISARKDFLCSQANIEYNRQIPFYY